MTDREIITQHDREFAISKIKLNDEKAVAIRALILAGRADDHPSVQAAAFYRVNPVKVFARRS